MQNSDFWTRLSNLYGSQTSPVILCMQYSVISTRITCLYWSQPLSVVFECKTATFGAELQVSMGPRHDLSFCACRRAWLATELLVSIGPCPHLRFLHSNQRLLDQNCMPLWVPEITRDFLHGNSLPSIRITSLYWSQLSSEVFACKPATFGPKLHVSMGPRNHLWFSAWKIAYLASELLVSICPSPHLWFLHAKQRLLDLNNKSLWIPDITCHFVHAIQRD